MRTNHLHANGPIAPCAALCPFPCYNSTIMQHVMLPCAVLVSWQTSDLIRPCNTLLPPDSRRGRIPAATAAVADALSLLLLSLCPCTGGQVEFHGHVFVVV